MWKWLPLAAETKSTTMSSWTNVMVAGGRTKMKHAIDGCVALQRFKHGAEISRNGFHRKRFVAACEGCDAQFFEINLVTIDLWVTFLVTACLLWGKWKHVKTISHFVSKWYFVQEENLIAWARNWLTVLISNRKMNVVISFHFQFAFVLQGSCF